MDHIQYDEMGLTQNCPKANMGCVTLAECKECLCFEGVDGWDVLCSYDDPEDNLVGAEL